ncbi:hypothetical protein ACSSS7_002216 [Eimeria intestinalis]
MTEQIPLFTSHLGGGVGTRSSVVGATVRGRLASPSANTNYPVRQRDQVDGLRDAFRAISLASASLDLPGPSRGFQSVPVSRSSSRAPSPSGSRPSSGQSTPSISRQQSFTFTPPSWHDASFISFKPTEAVPRLERTTSSPGVPHTLPFSTNEQEEMDAFPGLQVPHAAATTGILAEEAEFVMPASRQPCIVGWAEVENTKVTTFPSGKKLYRCTYCNTPLKRFKNYINTWAKVLFCQECKQFPQCNSCYKKAVPFIFTDVSGLRKRMEPILNCGGINICGQCALLNPIADRATVLDLVKRGRKFLKALFGVHFTEKLLEPHTEPEVISCLEALRAAGDSFGSCTIKLNSKLRGTAPVALAKSSSGEVAELPFEIGPVWHLQLSRGDNQSVYGRCETRALTFPPKPQLPGEESKGDSGPRTYRVVQRILLSRGMPEGLLYGHLVHELLHAFIWLFLNHNSVKIALAAEEGLCNCILAAALQLRVETLQARREATLDALLRRGVAPKTDPGVKEVHGIPEAADFLKAVVGMVSKAGQPKTKEQLESRENEAKQTVASLEYQLYVTEYELKVLNRRLGEMEKDSDPAYGVGYRRIRDLVTNLPVVRMVEILGRHGESIDSVVEASTVSS